MANPRRGKRFNSIAVIGNSLPRRCGIATFTTDLARALAKEAPYANCSIVAITDTPEGYDYPENVHFEITQNRLDDYHQAAEYLNINHTDVVYLQHEYGIFGGPSGSHIINLIDGLHMPIITTLHTILDKPTPIQKDILEEICKHSDRVISMSRRGIDYLQDIYNVPPEKIAFIHHGIPDVSFVDQNYYKDLFGVEGKKVLLTFGLLSPGKGVDLMIRALPEIVERHPDVVYIILGATHPHVLKHSGETHRLELQQLARKLGVDEHVIFQNRFVELSELCEFLGCADIYVTPYPHETQIVSGTLAYAMGVGKPIVSTPYWYAQEMLAEDRGRLIPFNDASALSREIIGLLDNDLDRHAVRKRAYTFTREAVWPQVARRHIQLYDEARETRIHDASRVFHARTVRMETAKLADLPELKLDHLLRMTDDTGIFQHAKYTVPNPRHGYCIDDNARALIVAVQAAQLTPANQQLADLSVRYLAFLYNAFNPETGRFRNFLGYDRHWLEPTGSEDSHGRALWGLGMAVGHLEEFGQISLASNLFHEALPPVENFTSPRAWAFTLTGIHAYLHRFSGDRDAQRSLETLSEKLLARFEKCAQDQWPWFEDYLTYTNARLPHALLLSGRGMGRRDMIDAGLKALEWLVELDFKEGFFAPVGNRGWHHKNKERARYDQQPVEAFSMIDACIEAYRISRQKKWIATALGAFNWFLGDNSYQSALYCDRNGGCCDGLSPDGVSENQGAESTLSWLMALSVLRIFQTERLLDSRRNSENATPTP